MYTQSWCINCRIHMYYTKILSYITWLWWNTQIHLTMPVVILWNFDRMISQDIFHVHSLFSICMARFAKLDQSSNQLKNEWALKFSKYISDVTKFFLYLQHCHFICFLHRHSLKPYQTTSLRNSWGFDNVMWHLVPLST